jgi:hypothetical protein
MTLPTKTRFDPSFAIAEKSGVATQFFRDFLTKLDVLVAAIAAGNQPRLVNAVDDAAAAAAGVQVGQTYRNGSVLMVRVV